MFDLTGHTALITGGGSGLGAAVAHGLAGQGAAVVLADLSVENLHQTKEQLIRAGYDEESVETVELDVTDRERVTDVVEELARRHNGLEILVNSAGVAFLEPVESVTDDHWDATLAVNLSGSFAAARAVASPMRAAGYGRIITIASQAAHAALQHHAAYAASKTGLFGLTGALARELGPHGVTANTVSPTVVMTELGRKAWDGPHGTAHKAEIPAGRFAEPEEVAAAVIYLASTEAAMVNGADLRVDGGFTIV